MEREGRGGGDEDGRQVRLGNAFEVDRSATSESEVESTHIVRHGHCVWFRSFRLPINFVDVSFP